MSAFADFKAHFGVVFERPTDAERLGGTYPQPSGARQSAAGSPEGVSAANQISQMGTDGRQGGIRLANRAGEIKASASVIAGNFDFSPLTLWRARALPLCCDGHFIRVHSC